MCQSLLEISAGEPLARSQSVLEPRWTRVNAAWVGAVAHAQNPADGCTCPPMTVSCPAKTGKTPPNPCADRQGN